MKFKIPKLFLKEKSIDFKPEDINWDDITICVLCMRKKCICDIHLCPCGISADGCHWPAEKCPCPKCLEVFNNCKCTVIIKKEE